MKLVKIDGGQISWEEIDAGIEVEPIGVAAGKSPGSHAGSAPKRRSALFKFEVRLPVTVLIEPRGKACAYMGAAKGTISIHLDHGRFIDLPAATEGSCLRSVGWASKDALWEITRPKRSGQGQPPDVTEDLVFSVRPERPFDPNANEQVQGVIRVHIDEIVCYDGLRVELDPWKALAMKLCLERDLGSHLHAVHSESHFRWEP